MSRVSTKSDWCSKPRHFLFQLWENQPAKGFPEIDAKPLWEDCWIPDGISAFGGAISVDSNSTNLGDMRHEWSLAIKYVKPSQAMFVRPAQHVPTHSTANEKQSSMHWHGALGAEVLGKAAIHSPLEGGQMSPANMVTAGCKCCWGSDILGVSVLQPP